MKTLASTILAAGLLFSTSSSAGVIINNLSLSSTELSFDVIGTIDVVGPNFNNQLVIGTIDHGNNWANSFDEFSSSWSYGGSDSTGTNVTGAYFFDNAFGEAIATTGSGVFEIGEILDMSFSLSGSFNTANFDLNTFALSVGGVNDSNDPYIQPQYNLVDQINIANVPEPSILVLLGAGLISMGMIRRRRDL